MAEQRESLLSGYRVLDLADERGLMCGQILGCLGADVVKVERPSGDAARNVGPFYHDIPDPEKSLYWWWTNLNKRGITLDIETADGQAIFKKLVEKADIVVESFEPGYMAGLGLGYEDLEAINPGIVMTSITPFGQSGPYVDSEYKVTDLVSVSIAGMTRIYGDPDRPPNRISYPQAYFQGGAQGAMGSMVALFHREMTGEGQQVDVSIQQSLALTLMMVAEFYEILGINYRGAGPFGGIPGRMSRWIWPCKDGYVYLMMGGGAALGVRVSTERLVAWANSEGYAMELKGVDWLSRSSAELGQEGITHQEDLVGEFIKTKTKAELLERAVRESIMCIPVNSTKDVVESPQLEDRGFWVQVSHPELGETFTYPGFLIKMSELTYEPQRRAPLIGEHNSEIYEKELSISRGELVLLKARGVI
ncbi:MAG: CoA transferase [Chloroflexota bacterium]|nr:CoA transferase [Chloroflexota bacterium]